MSEENRKAIRISVRNLVEFVLRSGDIDNRCSGNAQKDAMLAGGRIHRKIQKRMGSGYRAEVPLKHEVQDEEQESSYKSENAPRYHARDVAKYRCVQHLSLIHI